MLVTIIMKDGVVRKHHAREIEKTGNMLMLKADLTNVCINMQCIGKMVIKDEPVRTKEDDK